MEGYNGDEESWNRWKEVGYYNNDAESEYDSHEEREEIESALYAQIFFESHLEEDVDDPSGNTNVKQSKNLSNHHISDNSFPGTYKEEKLVPVANPLEDSADLQRFKSDTFLCNGFHFEKIIVTESKSDVKILTSSNFDSSGNQSVASKHSYGADLKLEQQLEKSGERTATKIKSTETIISENISEDDYDEDLLLDSDYSDDIILDESLSDMDDLHVHVNASQRSLLRKYGNFDSSSNTDSDWAVELDRPEISLRPKSRYYLIKPLNVQCYNCKESGHLSRDCPKPQKSQICYLCGFTGHNARLCPQGICYNCDEPGHEARMCPYSRKLRWKKCRRCQMYGHPIAICPDRWRCYHMTTTPGKLVKMKKRNRRKFCYNCSEAGHFGFECEEKRIDRYSNPTYPFIVQYKIVDTGTTEKHNKHKKHKKHIHFVSDAEGPPHKKTKTKHVEEKKELPAFLKQKDSALRNKDNVSNFDNMDVPTFVAYSKGLDPRNDSLRKELPWKDNKNNKARFDRQTGDHRKYSEEEDFEHQVFDNVWWHKIYNDSDIHNDSGTGTSSKVSKKEKKKKKKTKHSKDKIAVKDTKQKDRKQKGSKRMKDLKTEKARTSFEGPNEHLGEDYQFNKGQKKTRKRKKKDRINDFDKGHQHRHVVNNARIVSGNQQSSSMVTDLRIQVKNPNKTREQHYQHRDGNGKNPGNSLKPNQDQRVVKSDRGFRIRINIAK